MMAKTMKLGAVLSLVLMAVFALLEQTALTITAGTFAYHLLMRLAVGFAFDHKLQNRVDYNLPWFRLRRFEERLYAWLRVGAWKAAMPTFDPDAFDRHKHTWDEIAQAMCQAELVHEVIVVLSLLPMAASCWLGGGLAFAITSVLAATYDMMFVIMQRYNRPRILQIVERLKKRT